MSKSEYQDLIAEYKEQIRILKQEVAELQDAGKSKDSANKRTLQKLENVTDDLEKAQQELKRGWKTGGTLNKNHYRNTWQ